MSNPLFEGIDSLQPLLRPGKVREGAVSFGHLVDVFTLLDGRTLAIEGIRQLSGNAVGHADTLTGAAGCDEPHGRQVILALAMDFEWNLVVSATDAA